MNHGTGVGCAIDAGLALCPHCGAAQKNASKEIGRTKWQADCGTALVPCSGLGFALALAGPAAAQTKTLKMQASWPASLTLYENFTDFGKRVEVVTGGRIKIEPMPAGQVVPAFEVLDATHKKVIDGAHTWAGYWVGKNKAAILFTGGPGGPFGMDHMDYLSWMWHGGGLEKYNKFYQDTLKLNVVTFPILSTSPQALGWFKKKIDSLADFKGRSAARPASPPRSSTRWACAR